MIRRLCIALSLLFIASSVGCSAYVDNYLYTPRPALAEIPPAAGEQSPPLTASVSIIGIRRYDSYIHLPTSVEVRLRLDNNGTHKVYFDPKSLSLTDGSLASFPPPILQPPDPVTLDPMQSTTLSAFFPFPPGLSYDDMDMQTLQLRWKSMIDTRSVGQVIYFRRVFPIYYSSYYYYPPPPPVFFGGGVVIVHHR
jgi:hypothetical protein